MGLSVVSETVRKSMKANLARRLRPIQKPNLQATTNLKRVQFCKHEIDKSWAFVAVSGSKTVWLRPKGVGDKRWVLFEDASPTVPAYLRCSIMLVHAVVINGARLTCSSQRTPRDSIARARM